MLFLFTSIKSLLRPSEVNVESKAFRLHSQWTVVFLICSSILLGCRQFFGEPIACIIPDAKRYEDVVNTFCWIHSTFILPDLWNATVGVQVSHPGVGTYREGIPRTFKTYYQWVALFLLLQGLLFYIPRYIWKCFERKTIQRLKLNLDDPLLPKAEVSKSVELLAHSLNLHWGHNSQYFLSYIFCETLTFIIASSQIFFLDKFFDGAFIRLGLDVLEWKAWNETYRTDPLVQVFPRMTKCKFHDYGSSGDVQNFDALCILPLNILNEKIFIFLWFWLCFICVMTLLMICFYIILGIMPFLRYCLVSNRLVNKKNLRAVLSKGDISDWYILYSLSCNIENLHFSELIKVLAFYQKQNCLNDTIAVPLD